MLNRSLLRSLLILSFSFLLNIGFVYAQPVKVSQVGATQQFLTLSDLHFDPFLSCQQTPCPLIQKLNSAPASQWNEIFASEDHSVPVYRKDSNYSLLISSFTAAQKEAQAANVKFVLVLGDFLAHDFDKKFFYYSSDTSQAAYVRFVNKTMSFFASELHQAFPHTDIYWVMGNNDSHQYDYYIEPQGAFFKDVSQIAAPLIHEDKNRADFSRQFSRGGYYAVDAPSDPHLRLVILNSVLFSHKAKGPEISEAAEAELNWLHEELLQAARHKQKVLIAMHIPTGIDVYATIYLPFTIVEFWKPSYSKRFLAEIQQASPQILGVFQGHIHADAFQIVSGAEGQALPFTGTPSISPLFGNNPGFKIYSYSVPALRLVDFVTYYLDLRQQDGWKKEYDFDEVYQLNHSDGEMVNGMLQLKPTGELADHYKEYYALKTDSQPITKANKWMPYYWCAIRELTMESYRSCLQAEDLHSNSAHSGRFQGGKNLTLHLFHGFAAINA